MSLPGIRVLIVDDNSSNRLAMAAALEHLEAEVITARSGAEALRVLLDGEFCAILMDVQMPILGGFETAEFIRRRARTRDVPIIFVTAISSSDASVARGYGLGAVDYLFKPIPVDTLCAKVSVFVDLARKRVQIEEQARYLSEKAHELLVANTAIERANRELETFTSAVAHDLRAPLRGISGFSAALLEDHHRDLDDEGRDLLVRIRASASRMSDLIDDLLHLSHCSLDVMAREPVDLSEIASTCLARLARDDPQRAVVVRVAPALMAEGDSRLLRIALENLLQNAWKFSSRKRLAHIEVDRDPAGAYFVRDDGVGFDMAHASSLFGAFQRLHRADEFEGEGIGLITVKRVIERHGGTLRALSTVDHGATFTFTLAPPRSAA